MERSREVRLENIDGEDCRLISEALEVAHLVTGENGLSRKEKQICEIIDSLEVLDDDDLAAIDELESIDILTEPDPVGGIDSEPIDVAAQDISSKLEELPMDFNEIEDAILEQSKSQLVLLQP